MVLDLRFLSPAFVPGGPDHESAGIQAATVRDLLRWWYRALVGHEAVLGVTDVDLAEARLFGNSFRNVRCPLKIQVIPSRSFGIIPRAEEPPRTGVFVRVTPPMDALIYLAGSSVAPLSRGERDAQGKALDPTFSDPVTGKARRGPVLRQAAVAPGSRLAVHIGWKQGALDDRQTEDLVRAAASLVTLGGFGSRSRKGFGALAGEIEAPRIPETRAWWDSQAYGILHGPPLSAAAGFPPFPCLAYAIVTRDPCLSPTWHQALGRLGQHYAAIRPRESAAWIAGSVRPKRESSLFLTLSREPGGYRGVATLIPSLPEGEDIGELRRYAASFKESVWPDE